MTSNIRRTWEKLVLELKLIRNEDFGALVPLCLDIHSILWPKDNLETCHRQLQFLGFEIQKTCENLSEGERWEQLRRFLFHDKSFQVSSSRLQEIHEEDLLFKCVLEDRLGHPITIVFLLLHFAHYLDLPIALIQARHHFLLKWVRSGKTIYLDLYNEGRALSDQELIQVLNRSSSSLEVWSAKQLMQQYLELLIHTFHAQQNLTVLHNLYNLVLQIDEDNTAVLGQRALLRRKLGYNKEAMADLKRYFSFVEKAHAPADLQQAWLELENQVEVAPRPPADLLH